MLLWTAIPIYWMVVTSLNTIRKFTAMRPPDPPKAHVVKLCHRVPSDPYLLFLRNSVVVAVSSTVCRCSSPVWGRMLLPGSISRSSLLARGLVFTYLVPTSLLFIPISR